MKKAQGQDTMKALMGYLLPAGTLEYFDCTELVKDKNELVLLLEEKKEPPVEYKGLTLHCKCLLREVRVQDFPIRDQIENHTCFLALYY